MKKLRIAQYLGGPKTAWGDLTPTTMREKGLGGRETALLMLSEEWAKVGHEVINLVHVEEPEQSVYDSGGRVNYCDVELAGEIITNFPVDVLISWEEPRLFGSELIVESSRLRIIEMQVAHLDTTEELDANTDVYAVLSNWAGQFLKTQNAISKNKITVLPNGVDLKRFPNPKLKHPGKGPYKFYYSSSPDRGLHHLLKAWPKILDRYPGSELSVAYGIEHWAQLVMMSHNMQCETALDVLEGLDQKGINYLGKIGQQELAQVQSESHALLYPCDTMQPTETGCITIIEAAAAGVPVITTNADCLESEFSYCTQQIELPFCEDRYVDAISTVMDDPKLYESLQWQARSMAEMRSWGRIAYQWLVMFDRKLQAKEEAKEVVAA